MATSKRMRITMGFLAGLFLLTSSALTIGVILQATQGDSSDNSDVQTEQPQNKLKGTKLSGFTPTESVPKLKKQDLKEGDGATVKPGDSVTVDYTGAVAKTGVVFESSKGADPVSFSLKEVIAGWSQGIPGMKEGGTRRLLIPADLAYGNNPPPQSGIPPDADLVFDVTLKKIGK